MSNVIAFDGNLAADAETSETSNGRKRIRIRVFDNFKRFPKTKDDKNLSNVFSVSYFVRPENRLAQYLTKGTSVMVTGVFEAREYTSNRDGQKHMSLDVTADQIKLLESPRNTDGGGGSDQGAKAPSAPANTAPDNVPDGDGLLDDLPF